MSTEVYDPPRKALVYADVVAYDRDTDQYHVKFGETVVELDSEAVGIQPDYRDFDDYAGEPFEDQYDIDEEM